MCVSRSGVHRVFCWLVPSIAVGLAACSLSPKEQLGARLFVDSQLSLNQNQSCAACHTLETGGTGPDAAINNHGSVYEGSVPGRFGNRKPPSAVYATFAPLFDRVADNSFAGGNFWDGRATGWKLGNPAADQAQGPFVNPAEQALPSAAEVVERVCGGGYGDLFRRVWGDEVCANVETGYSAVAQSIAAIEGSDEVSPFDSKYDLVLRRKAKLTGRERQGLDLFKGKGKCSACHVMDGAKPLFTDFTFDNLGIPPNPENPFYQMDEVLVDGKPLNPEGRKWLDPGLGGFLQGLAKDDGWRTQPHVPAGMLGMDSASLLAAAQENYGKHRVPTLRNVDKRPHPKFVKAFGHNGYFKSLESIVHFYNTRDVLPACPTLLTDSQAQAAECWPAAEVTSNVNRSELGNLGLTPAEEAAIVAFLRTLSDG